MVYNRTMQDHIDHVRRTLQVLWHQRLYAKVSKCAFFRHQVEYLGHVVTAEGIAPDLAKVQAASNWKISANVHYVRSFSWPCRLLPQIYSSVRADCCSSHRSHQEDFPIELVPKGGGGLQCLEAGSAQCPGTPVGGCGKGVHCDM